ncbi:hypothetical protein FRB99_006145 [Tulasnella sp. 403]|nr:hypothetical protein FRB99_006145 [Tulasnella sp. 403]
MRGFAVSAALVSGLVVVNVNAEAPEWKPSAVKGVFLEQFGPDWASRWTPSEATKKTPVGGETFSYVGKWSVEDASSPSILGDKGLVAKTKASLHAISAPLSAPLDPAGKTFVLQYEVKYQKGGNCGGGYLKLLEDGSLANKEFSDTTPWVIMFGPDLTCPGTKACSLLPSYPLSPVLQVHFIFRHQNPVTKEFEEKHLASPPSPVIDDMTKLYTLIVHPNNTYNVLVDDEVSSEGNLLENFTPAVNPPKEIDDPEDVKPGDWVDDAQIRDPDAKKPDDWDETQPFQILDEEAEIPEGWLVDEPAEIPDPDAEKPEEWDDEEDGDWVGPMIKNPKCEDAPGCGPWKRPMKTNPLYKGVWVAPMIDNPAYKGVWSPRQIANPNYYEDVHPANFRPIGAVGIELWTMTEDIMFDNIYIGHSPEDAKALAAETFHVKHKLEQAQKDKAEEERKAKDTDAGSKSSGGIAGLLANLKDDPIGFIRALVWEFVDEVKEEGPLEAFKANPQVGGVLLATLLTFFAAIGALFGLVGSSPQPVVKASKAEGKETGTKPSGDVSKAATTTATPASSDSTVKKRK